MSGKADYSLIIFLAGVLVAGLLVALGASVLIPGQSPIASYGATDNGKTVSVAQGSTFKVVIDENPTTGYSWNETVTPGLTITDSKYIGSNSGLMGAGGKHEYTIEAMGKGTQQLSAIYKRPWEPTTGNEDKYVLNIMVV